MSTTAIRKGRLQLSKLTPEQQKAAVEERKAAGKAKAAAALERLDASITRLIEDDTAFAEYLRLSGRMHGYSFGNRLLIWAQRPDAGMVAGFHRWRDLDRPVRKGSKGIQILAPMVIKRDAGAENAGMQTMDGPVGADGKVSKVVGFRVSYVFSVHDTEGAPFAMPSPVTVDDDSERAKALLDLLVDQTRRSTGLEWALEGDLPEGAQGRYMPSTGVITLRAGMPAGQSAKTLIHELAHHYTHKSDPSYADGEITAEAVAFVVASHYGLDTTGYSAPYVAAWAKGDLKRFRSLLDRIMRVAGELINDGEQCPKCLGAGCEECR